MGTIDSVATGTRRARRGAYQHEVIGMELN